MDWEGVWEGKGVGPVLTRIALTPLAALNFLGWESYRAVYSLGIKKPAEPHKPIICVGNLRVGGTGKSPVALYVARVCRELGRDVVLGCSGYGSPRQERASLASFGELNPTEWGDEPAMFRFIEPDLPLVVGRDRVRAAELVHASNPKAVLVMDDGFQHLRLRNHISLLIDPTEGNALTMPAGPYRAPRWERSLATTVLPGEFQIAHGPIEFWNPDGLAWENQDCGVICALGSPSKFVASLEAQGVTVSHKLFLPDHDPLQAGTLWSQWPANLPIVTTAKDWVKLRLRTDSPPAPVFVAMRKTIIEPADQFKQWLKSKLDEFRI